MDSFYAVVSFVIIVNNEAVAQLSTLAVCGSFKYTSMKGQENKLPLYDSVLSSINNNMQMYSINNNMQIFAHNLQYVIL